MVGRRRMRDEERTLEPFRRTSGTSWECCIRPIWPMTNGASCALGCPRGPRRGDRPPTGAWWSMGSSICCGPAVRGACRPRIPALGARSTVSFASGSSRASGSASRTPCAPRSAKPTDAHRRHLFATRCIESGVDIPTVRRWLGHEDGGALAMRTYGQLRDSIRSADAPERDWVRSPKRGTPLPVRTGLRPVAPAAAGPPGPAALRPPGTHWPAKQP